VIKIVTDSTADIPADLMERYDMRTVPINIQFEQETFRENIDIDRPTFLEKLEVCMPTSSQPAPGQFLEIFEPLVAEGHSILTVTVTSKHSGTYQSAMLAKSMLPDAEIGVFDSLSISIGTGYHALEAARAAEKGQSMAAIIQRLEGIRAKTHLYFTPATLKYLQRSGRVGTLAGVLGALLSLKPIIKTDDGTLEVAQRIRTRAKSLDRLIELTTEAVGTSEPVRLGIIHAEVPDEAEALRARLEEQFNVAEMLVVPLACSLTVHGGPGIIGIISMPANP
jgi:DegV family protein with EDD domain